MGASSTTFRKGDGRPRKPKGAVTKTTKAVKEVFADVFNELQTDKKANLKTWGTANPTEFYKLASKLIPVDIAGKLNIHVSDEPIIIK